MSISELPRDRTDYLNFSSQTSSHMDAPQPPIEQTLASPAEGTSHCIAICPGVVWIKNALSKEEQIEWAKYALTVGEDPSQGFWRTWKGKREPNMGDRGRVYDRLDAYKDYDQVLKLVRSLLHTAMTFDATLPEMNPTHLLLNMYTTTRGMSYHADDDPNDGDNDHPIVSLSLGNTCEFGMEINGVKQTKDIESGDVLIWGGPSRMLRHAVIGIEMNTCPEWLPLDNVRINFTFRDAPNILGREDEWKVKTYDFGEPEPVDPKPFKSKTLEKKKAEAQQEDQPTCLIS